MGDGPDIVIAAASKRVSDRTALIMTLTIFVGFVGGLIWLLTFKPGLSACEDAIKATLKAPATYQRVKVDGPSGDYSITYYAENSFGVPLRGTGQCLIIDGKVDWFESAN